MAQIPISEVLQSLRMSRHRDSDNPVKPAPPPSANLSPEDVEEKFSGLSLIDSLNLQ
jgi:hypothetical protein